MKKKFSYVGDDTAAAAPAATPAKKGSSFDAVSFLETAAPGVLTAAESAMAKKDDKKPADAPTDATGKKPGGSTDSGGSFLTNPVVLIGGGAAVLGLGYFLLRRK